MARPQPGNKKKKISKRNRDTKQLLVFDENARRDYLTGFRKRKDERRRKAAEQMIHEMKEEKRRLKQQVRDMMKARVDNQPSVPEVQHLLDPQVFDLPSHTITVTDVSEVDLSGKDGLWLGQNTFKDVEDEKEVDDGNENSEKSNKQSQPQKPDPKEVKRLKRKMAKIGHSNVKKILQSRKKKSRRKKPSSSVKGKKSKK